LDCFSKAHLVSQDSPLTGLEKLRHPSNTSTLIGPQLLEGISPHTERTWSRSGCFEVAELNMVRAFSTPVS
jgi:hypothetical protein